MYLIIAFLIYIIFKLFFFFRRIRLIGKFVKVYITLKEIPKHYFSQENDTYDLIIYIPYFY